MAAGDLSDSGSSFLPKWLVSLSNECYPYLSTEIYQSTHPMKCTFIKLWNFGILQFYFIFYVTVMFIPKWHQNTNIFKRNILNKNVSNLDKLTSHDILDYLGGSHLASSYGWWFCLADIMGNWKLVAMKVFEGKKSNND